MEELLKQLMAKMDEGFSAIHERLDRIENKLESTFEQSALSTEGVTEIKQTMDRHERILEVLSLRSIEHESHLKR